MDNIEKFLLSISHKFPKGYPDITNESDKLILEQELSNFLSTPITLTEVKLDPTQLRKPFYDGSPYDDRGEKLLDKINKEEPIELISGEMIVIDKDESQEAISLLINKEYNEFGGGKKLFVGKDGKKYSLSNFKKSKEFGSGKGSGGGAEATAIQESSQCVVNAIAFNVLNKTISANDLNEENIKKAFPHTQTTNTLEECMEFILNQKGWEETFVETANKLKKEFDNEENYTFHRGSPYVQSIYNSLKSTKVGLTADKWNPADIWIVSKSILNTPPPSDSIENLNEFIKQQYIEKQLIGVSLKKIKNTPNMSVYNFEEEDQPQHKLEGFKSTEKSNNVDIMFDGGNKITLRTFNFATNFAGEIMGKTAAHGKVGLTTLNEIFNNQLPSTKQVSEKFLNQDETLLAEFQTYYNEIVAKRELDWDYLNEKGENWVVSKFIATMIAYLLNESENSNELLTQIVGYASSQTNKSSTFVKIYE